MFLVARADGRSNSCKWNTVVKRDTVTHTAATRFSLRYKNQACAPQSPWSRYQKSCVIFSTGHNKELKCCSFTGRGIYAQNPIIFKVASIDGNRFGGIRARAKGKKAKRNFAACPDCLTGHRRLNPGSYTRAL